MLLEQAQACVYLHKNKGKDDQVVYSVDCGQDFTFSGKEVEYETRANSDRQKRKQYEGTLLVQFMAVPMLYMQVTCGHNQSSGKPAKQGQERDPSGKHVPFPLKPHQLSEVQAAHTL